MLDLSKKYGAKKAFKDDEIIAEIVAMTYPAVGEFFKTHVQGNTPIDYTKFFDKTGISKQMRKVNTRYFVDFSNRPYIGLNAKREIHFTNTSNTGLAALGVQLKDVIKKINGEEMTLQNANNLLVKTLGWKAGDKISLEIVRDGKTITLEGTAIVPQIEQESLTVEELSADNPKVKLRNAWMKG